MGSVEPRPTQQGRSGCGWNHARGGGAVRRREAPRGALRRATRRYLPAAARAAALDTQGRWEAAAAGHSDGEGSNRADGGEARHRADLRSRIQGLVVRVPATPERASGAGDHPGDGEHRMQPRPRRRHPRLLREHRSGALDAAGGAEDHGPEGAQAAAQVASGWGDGRGAARRDGLGDTAGRGDLSVALERLPGLPRLRVGTPVRRNRQTGALCGRLRRHLQNAEGG